MAEITELSNAPKVPKSSASGSLFKDSGNMINALVTALTNIPDPDTVLAEAGISRVDLRKMEEVDDEIYGALETRRDSAVATPWRLEPQPNTPQPAVDFLWDVLDPHIESMLNGFFSAVPYGYSVTEVVYKRLEGRRVGIECAGEKPMEWFRPTPDGKLVGALHDQGSTLDTDFKYILTRRRATFQQPYGQALLSRLYWPWFFRHNTWQFWMTFLERFGDPLLLGKAHNPTALSEALLQIGAEAHVVVGTEEDISAVTTGHSGEFSKAEDAINRRIQKVILGQTLTTDVGDKGSFAAANVHNEVRQDRKAADLRMMAGSLQRVVNALWALNRFQGLPPAFVLADAKGVEPDRADRDSKLVTAGVLHFTPQYLLRTYDFEEGDFVAGKQDESGGNDDENADPHDKSGRKSDENDDEATDTAAAGGINLADGQRFTKRQSELEALADRLTGQATAPIQEDAIKRAVLAASDPEDLADRLALLLSDRSLAEFQEITQQALYAADLIGYAQEATGRPAADIQATPEPQPNKRESADDAIYSEILKTLREGEDGA